ncbi:MAG: Spo0B domain-containing protein [Desulfitobacteriia bacterium]|jgi:hypothetical protein
MEWENKADYYKCLLKEQLNNCRFQRHDFLNHFQVIKGYLQLGMPDKAAAYIEEAVDSMAFQQQIFLISCPELSSILFSWFFKLRARGIEMTLSFPEEMAVEEFWTTRWQEEYGERFLGYTKDCLNCLPGEVDPEQLRARVRLITLEEGFGCQFRLFYGEDLRVEKDFQSQASED